MRARWRDIWLCVWSLCSACQIVARLMWTYRRARTAREEAPSGRGRRKPPLRLRTAAHRLLQCKRRCDAVQAGVVLVGRAGRSRLRERKGESVFLFLARETGSNLFENDTKFKSVRDGGWRLFASRARSVRWRHLAHHLDGRHGEVIERGVRRVPPSGGGAPERLPAIGGKVSPAIA